MNDAAQTATLTPETGSVPVGFPTTAEAAAFLRVSVRWLRAGLGRPETAPGSVPAYRLPMSGGRAHWRFDADELRAWAHAGFPPVAEWRERQALAAGGANGA